MADAIGSDWTDRNLAPVFALSTFADRLVGADLILLIESEAVEAALIKGYSSREDMCEIISVFWEMTWLSSSEFVCLLTGYRLMRIRLIASQAKQQVGLRSGPFGFPCPGNPGEGLGIDQ